MSAHTGMIPQGFHGNKISFLDPPKYLLFFCAIGFDILRILQLSKAYNLGVISLSL